MAMQKNIFFKFSFLIIASVCSQMIGGAPVNLDASDKTAPTKVVQLDPAEQPERKYASTTTSFQIIKLPTNSSAIPEQTSPESSLIVTSPSETDSNSIPDIITTYTSSLLITPFPDTTSVFIIASPSTVDSSSNPDTHKTTKPSDDYSYDNYKDDEYDDRLIKAIDIDGSNSGPSLRLATFPDFRKE